MGAGSKQLFLVGGSLIYSLGFVLVLQYNANSPPLYLAIHEGSKGGFWSLRRLREWGHAYTFALNS